MYDPAKFDPQILKNSLRHVPMSSAFKFDFSKAYEKLDELEKAGAGYDLKETLAKANFNDIITEAINALERNKKIIVRVTRTHMHNETPTENAKVVLQMYDEKYCKLQGLDRFDSKNNFYADIYADYLLDKGTAFDDENVTHLAFDDRRVLRVAKTIYLAWKKWQYDTAYEIVGGKGTAKNLNGLRADIIDKARADEWANKHGQNYKKWWGNHDRLNDEYAEIDVEQTKKVIEEISKDHDIIKAKIKDMYDALQEKASLYSLFGDIDE